MNIEMGNPSCWSVTRVRQDVCPIGVDFFGIACWTFSMSSGVQIVFALPSHFYLSLEVVYPRSNSVIGRTRLVARCIEIMSKNTTCLNETPNFDKALRNRVVHPSNDPLLLNGKWQVVIITTDRRPLFSLPPYELLSPSSQIIRFHGRILYTCNVHGSSCPWILYYIKNIKTKTKKPLCFLLCTFFLY